MTTVWADETWYESATAAARANHARHWASVFGLAFADGLTFLLVHFLVRAGHNVPTFVLFAGERRHASPPIDLFTLVAAVFIAVRYLSGDYGRRQLFWDGVKIILIALLVASLPDFFMMLLGNGLYKPMPLLFSWACLIIFLPLMRQLARVVMARLGIWQIATAIIGASPRTAEVYEALQHSLSLGFEVRWLVIENHEMDVPPSMSALRVLHSSDPSRIASILSLTGCKEVIVSAEDMQSVHLSDVTRRLLEVNIPVAMVPAVTRLPLAGVTANYFFGRDILLLQSRSNAQRTPWRIVKRLFDVVVSFILLVLLLPLFIVVAVAIKRTDSGPATYSQARIGRRGVAFRCIKFRTMVSDAEARLKAWRQEEPALYEEYLKTFKLKNDPRVTPIGKWLRRTSLDELPQLLNVLRGEMSLVGPRPVLAQELDDYYGPATQLYIRVRPGMTGLWQVSGRSDTSYERRVILDEWYILNWSLWYDIVILIQTAWIVLARKGAF